jgi:formylglycine-generating enzyme
MIRIPATSFLMGNESGPENERPAHRERVDAFELAVCPVTNGEYDAFLEATGAERRTFDDAMQPVVSVSWLDAVAYCEWLGVRLPTEAEWECAARGGIERKLYPWGDEPPQSRPGYESRWRNGPERVGSGTPNAYGLLDLCENVHEWCSDWYAAGYYAVSPETNPRGPEMPSRLRQIHAVRSQAPAARREAAPGVIRSR